MFELYVSIGFCTREEEQSRDQNGRAVLVETATTGELDVERQPCKPGIDQVSFTAAEDLDFNRILSLDKDGCIISAIEFATKLKKGNQFFVHIGLVVE